MPGNESYKENRARIEKIEADRRAQKADRDYRNGERDRAFGAPPSSYSIDYGKGYLEKPYITDIEGVDRLYEHHYPSVKSSSSKPAASSSYSSSDYAFSDRSPSTVTTSSAHVPDKLTKWHLIGGILAVIGFCLTFYKVAVFFAELTLRQNTTHSTTTAIVLGVMMSAVLSTIICAVVYSAIIYVVLTLHRFVLWVGHL